MKKPNITPDKWEHRGNRVFRKNSYEIAYISQQGAHPEWSANGAAIAALPDLLMTLESLYSGLGDLVELADGQHGGMRDVGTRNLIQEKRDWVKSALTKAGYTF